MSQPLQAYCVKCKRMREMTDAQRVVMPSKGATRPAAKGVCVVCGTGMYKILAVEATV